jgi:hypothetical protein
MVLSFFGVLLIIRPPFVKNLENLLFYDNPENNTETLADPESNDQFKATLFGIASTISYTLAILTIDPLKGKVSNCVMV